LTKYTPRDTRNQGRPLKRLLEEWDRNMPAMACFPESEMMMVCVCVYTTNKHIFLIKTAAWKSVKIIKCNQLINKQFHNSSWYPVSCHNQIQ
jgi:hypothetical protein